MADVKKCIKGYHKQLRTEIIRGGGCVEHIFIILRTMSICLTCKIIIEENANSSIWPGYYRTPVSSATTWKAAEKWHYAAPGNKEASPR